jgi:hypothetical protein
LQTLGPEPSVRAQDSENEKRRGKTVYAYAGVWENCDSSALQFEFLMDLKEGWLTVR